MCWASLNAGRGADRDKDGPLSLGRLLGCRPQPARLAHSAWRWAAPPCRRRRIALPSRRLKPSHTSEVAQCGFSSPHLRQVRARGVGSSERPRAGRRLPLSPDRRGMTARRSADHAVRAPLAPRQRSYIVRDEGRLLTRNRCAGARVLAGRALGEGGLGLDRRSDDLDAFAAEEAVSGAAELRCPGHGSELRPPGGRKDQPARTLRGGRRA
jgi:hypothetical protein